MIKQVMFGIKFGGQGKRTRQDDGPFFHGRNGLGICVGMEVWRMPQGEIVRLTPHSTKGSARGYIEVPKEDIPALIEALKAVA